MDEEMMAALEADGEKLRQLTGEDHGPEFLFDCETCGGEGYIARTVQVYEAGCGFSHPDGREKRMASILCKRPVAFRVLRSNPATAGQTLSATEWRYLDDEDEAYKASDALGTEYQCLYIRDGTAIVAEWEPIGSAPTDGSFLVCAVGDDRGPFVVSGQILAMARKSDTPSHLGLSYLTHWMPLPAPPQRA